jgi:hypothetical protein
MKSRVESNLRSFWVIAGAMFLGCVRAILLNAYTFPVNYYSKVVDPGARFLVSASSNCGWHGDSTRTVFVHDIKPVDNNSNPA